MYFDVFVVKMAWKITRFFPFVWKNSLVLNVKVCQSLEFYFLKPVETLRFQIPLSSILPEESGGSC